MCAKIQPMGTSYQGEEKKFSLIRRHFLAAAVDPAVSLSMYSTLPMEVVP